jgi:zinc protease
MRRFITLAISLSLLLPTIVSAKAFAEAFAEAFAGALGKRSVLNNGLILLVAERPEIPMVVVAVLVKAGSAQDQEGKEGLANLTALLLTRGSKEHNALVLAEELDFLGASLSANVDYDLTTLTLTTLHKNLTAATALLTEVLLSPTFPTQELDKKRQEVFGYLKTHEEDPGWVAQKTFLETLYAQHPYGRVIEGSEESLAALSRADVVAFHQTYYRPNNVMIACAGSISQEEATALFEEQLKDWQPEEIPYRPWPELSLPKNSAVVTRNKEVSQANVILGHQGIARDNPNYYAVQVMNYLLGGGGFESLLMKRLREELGLVYHVGSSFSARKNPGPFTIVLQTKNASARQAVEESLQVVRKFIDEGTTDQDLARAKAFLINSFPLHLTSNRNVAGLLPLLEFYGLGLDYPDRYADLINQVTLDKVQQVAKSYLRPEHLLKVVVADLSQADFASPTPH